MSADPQRAAIYGLTCPTTGALRYIGKAVRPAARFKDHLRERRRKSPLYDWIAKLSANGLTPGMIILEQNPPDWREAERRLIAEARARGDRLLNLADGGDEPLCSRDTRAENGRANAAAIHSDPLRKEVWSLKKNIGSALREGFMSNTARAKLRLAARLSPDLFGCYASLPDREEKPDGSPVQGYGRTAPRRAA